MLITYDTWRLQGPLEDDIVGIHEGEACGRYHEPDEDAPCGYRPKPCSGAMLHRQEGAESFETHWAECDTCGEVA